MGQNIWVRMAVEGDLDWLLGELKRFDHFAGTAKSMFPKDVDLLVEKLIGMMKEHVLLIAEKSGARLGFVGGFLLPHLFNSDIYCLQETFWWVCPEHRKTSAGIRLLEAFDEAGRAIGVDWVFFSLMHNSPVNDRCLTKRGYRPQEHYYLKELPDASSNEFCNSRAASFRRRSGGFGCGEQAPGEEDGEGAEEGDPSAAPDNRAAADGGGETA